MQEKIRRCTQVVVRGRTRNAIGPQGRVGSTPTISAFKKLSGSYSPARELFSVQRINLTFRAFRLYYIVQIETNQIPGGTIL